MAAPAWEGCSRGNRLGYGIFIRLLKAGGLRSAYGLLQFVSLYYRFFVPAATRPPRCLYDHRPHLPPRTPTRLIKKNIIPFGQTLIDKIAVLAGVRHGLTFEHEGIRNLEDMVTAGQGGVIVSAHLGNWEVAGHLLRRIEAPINVLM